MTQLPWPIQAQQNENEEQWQNWGGNMLHNFLTMNASLSSSAKTSTF
jgi:hypothetical protein